MWQRKTAEAIRRVDRRLRFVPTFAIGFSLFAATFMTIAASWGFWGYLVPPHPPLPLARAFRVFPLFFLFMFLGLYLTHVFRRIPKIPDKSAMICDECHEITDYATDERCSCGGRLELLMHWTWVPHPSDPPDSTPPTNTLRYRYSRSGELLSGPNDARDQNAYQSGGCMISLKSKNRRHEDDL
jgi:hypothetical protein